jgi:hypothetical protein
MNYTREDVDRILEASKKATPGKWEHEYIEGESPIGSINRNDGELLAVVQECRECAGNRVDQRNYRNANAEFIAGAPILAEEVTRLRAEIQEMKDEAEQRGWDRDLAE